MQPKDLTTEQIEDIKERELKAIEMLRELQLIPAANTISSNIGDDHFAMKVVPFLQDTKYLGKKEEVITDNEPNKEN